MKRYLIEVPHGADKHACDHAIKVFQETGSHFLTNAEWGCMDGEHKAWMIVDVDSKEDAMYIVPPVFRSVTKITQLVTFTPSDISHPEKYHAE
ncbi:MAG: hypothetical protein MUC31_01190 [Bacteroidales bacterium]|jgi:hypothetical protein|nr:hypothetical protein [Bacteroidales bacterium]